MFGDVTSIKENNCVRYYPLLENWSVYYKGYISFFRNNANITMQEFFASIVGLGLRLVTVPYVLHSIFIIIVFKVVYEIVSLIKSKVGLLKETLT